MRFVFRLTCAPSHSLFKTLSNSNRLLWHFRFVAFSFINTLSTYFYDVAIQGNFNSLLARIAICRESEAWNNPREFQDVFALAQCHSLVLDDILGACLLRSSQKLASDALRGAMQIVLKFCILVGDLKDAQLEPRQAAATLESLYGNFREKVSTLVSLFMTPHQLSNRTGIGKNVGSAVSKRPEIATRCRIISVSWD